MLYLDIPSQQQIKSLCSIRADACVSLFVKTTPLSQQIQGSIIELGNLQKQANEQLEATGFDKRRLALINDHLDALKADEDFWRLQANSLAILVTPDKISTFRLANALENAVYVSDRFHINPLLRAVTFPHSCFVLALSENQVRLVEVHAQLAPKEVRIPELPKDAASYAGKSTLNDRSASGKIQGSEGQNIRLMQFARGVDNALRPFLSGYDVPLILAATGRLAGIYPSINSYSALLEHTIDTSPDRLSEAELAALAQPLLDASYADQVKQLQALYEDRKNAGRATVDLAAAARAATYGAIDTLMVDLNDTEAGVINESDGVVQFGKEDHASYYNLVDEIAGRALLSGARVVSVRKDDMPHGSSVAAILRYAL